MEVLPVNSTQEIPSLDNQSTIRYHFGYLLEEKGIPQKLSILSSVCQKTSPFSLNDSEDSPSSIDLFSSFFEILSFQSSSSYGLLHLASVFSSQNPQELCPFLKSLAMNP